LDQIYLEKLHHQPERHSPKSAAKCLTSARFPTTPKGDGSRGFSRGCVKMCWQAKQINKEA